MERTLNKVSVDITKFIHHIVEQEVDLSSLDEITIIIKNLKIRKAPVLFVDLFSALLFIPNL